MKTKHIILPLLLTCILFVRFPASAQLGIKGGIGFSDIVYSDDGQAQYLGYEVDHLIHNYPLFTYQFGIFGNIKINNHFDFQPELMIIKQGINYDIDFIYQDMTYRLYLWYVQIPLVIRYSFSLKKKHQPNFFLGPYLSFNIYSKRITNYDGNCQIEKISNVRPVDFGFVAGFGYDFNLQKGQLYSGLSFSYSLINMMDTQTGYIPNYDDPENLKARNISITLLVGYRFINLFNKKENK